eukprot:6883033-Prymnesium_polylepis.2
MARARRHDDTCAMTRSRAVAGRGVCAAAVCSGRVAAGCGGRAAAVRRECRVRCGEGAACARVRCGECAACGQLRCGVMYARRLRSCGASAGTAGARHLPTRAACHIRAGMRHVRAGMRHVRAGAHGICPRGRLALPRLGRELLRARRE